MKVLFSPVGTADPLTILGDGPMLNIIRYYHPDKVVLFFSPKMAAYEKDDKRYTKAIKKLCESMEIKCPEFECKFSPHQEVYQFDYYIKEFEEILTDIAKKNPSAEILVNVSSGTPAMEQALVALGSFGYLDMQMLQVKTPRNDINDRSDREDPDNYDLETLWECSLDEECDTTNRIHVVDSPNFSARLLSENARTLVSQYEYEAAAKILLRLRDDKGKALNAVRAAASRLNLDRKPGLARIFSSDDIAFRFHDSLEDQLAEYIWVMEVRYQQGHWADFTRSVTPALSKLILLSLKPSLDEAEWSVLSKEGKLEKEDFKSVKQSKYLGFIAREALSGKRKVPFLSNSDLMRVLKAAQKSKAFGNKELYNHLSDLRDFESGCRNKIAHEIQQTSRKVLESISGFDLVDIKDLVFESYNEIVDSNPIEPGLYDRINDRILSLI